MYIKQLNTTNAESSESDLEPEKPTEIISHSLQIPDSVRTVIDRIEESQLTRAKEDMKVQLNEIMLQVNRIINRYQGDIELTSFRKMKDPSLIEKDSRKNRSTTLEQISRHMQSADTKERTLHELLLWLEEWHTILSELTISDEDEIDYYEWIADMEALPDSLSTTELNINSLIALSMYFLKERKRQKKRLASKGTLWKSWREKTLRKPASGTPLKPEQMIKDENVTANRIAEVLGMLHELVSSNIFTKAEINVIKYMSTTTANLHKALGLQSQEIKNLIFQYTTMGSEIKEYYGIEKQTFQRTVQILSDKTEALERELQNQEEKYMQLLQSKANLEHQLNLAGASILADDSTRKRKELLLRLQDKIKEDFEESGVSENKVIPSSSQETTGVEVPKKEVPVRKKAGKGTGIKWDLTSPKGKSDSSSESKSPSPVSPTSPAKPAMKPTKEIAEEHPAVPSTGVPSTRVPSTEALVDRPKPQVKATIPEAPDESKPPESQEEYDLLTDASKMGRPPQQQQQYGPPERKKRKEAQDAQQAEEPQEEEKMQKPAAEEAMRSREARPAVKSESEESVLDQVTHQKVSKKVKAKKGKTVQEAAPIPDQKNEMQILQDYQRALMSFLQQKIDSLRKPDSFGEVRDLVPPKNPEAQRSLKMAKEKIEEYFQKVVEILTNSLKNYREKRVGKPGEPVVSSPSYDPSLPQSYLTLDERVNPMLANLFKLLFSEVDATVKEIGEAAEMVAGTLHKDSRFIEDEEKPEAESLEEITFQKNQALQFIKQLQEERRLWKETQEQMQKKLQEENAWFRRRDEKRRWELKQKQWQAEEDLWKETQQQWNEQEREFEERRRQWETEAARHKVLEPKELERWKQQMMEKLQQQHEFQLQEMERQEEELRQMYPEVPPNQLAEWKERVKERMEEQWQSMKHTLEEVTPQVKTPSQQQLVVPAGERRQVKKVKKPLTKEEIALKQDILEDTRASYLPDKKEYDESHPPPGEGPMPLFIAGPQESPISWGSTIPKRSPISRVPTISGESLVSWGSPTPEEFASLYPTDSGESLPLTASAIFGEIPPLWEPGAFREEGVAVPGVPPTLRSPLAAEQPPWGPEAEAPGAPRKPLPSRFPVLPEETSTLLGPLAPRETPLSWDTSLFETYEKFQVLDDTGQPQMLWAPEVSGQSQISWVPTLSEQPQMSWTPTASGQPEMLWTPTAPGQPEMLWTPTAPGQPEMSWAPTAPGAPQISQAPIAPGQPEVSWAPTVLEPSKISQVPTVPGQPETLWAPTAPGAPQISQAPTAPGQPEMPWAPTVLEPSKIPYVPTAPGQPEIWAPTVPEPSQISQVSIAPEQRQVSQAPTVPRQPQVSWTPASPGQQTQVSWAPVIPEQPQVSWVPPAPGKPQVSWAPKVLEKPGVSESLVRPQLVPIAPGQPQISGPPTISRQPEESWDSKWPLTSEALAALGQLPTPGFPAVPGQLPIPIAPAAPGQFPTLMAPAAPGQFPTLMAPVAPGQLPTLMAPAAPGQLPTLTAPAAPGQLPTLTAPAAPGQFPTLTAPAAPGQLPTLTAPAAPGQLPTLTAPAAPGQLPTLTAPAAPGQLPTLTAPAAPGQLPTLMAPAAPGQLPTLMAPAAPGQLPTLMAPAAPGQLPTLMAPAAPGQLPIAQIPAAPRLPPISMAPAVPGQPPTPVAPFVVTAGPEQPPSISWTPSTPAPTQLSWASEILEQAQISWIPGTPEETQIWTPDIPKGPPTSWPPTAPGEPQKTWGPATLEKFEKTWEPAAPEKPGAPKKPQTWEPVVHGIPITREQPFTLWTPTTTGEAQKVLGPPTSQKPQRWPPTVPGETITSWPSATSEETYMPEIISPPGETVLTLFPPDQQFLGPLAPEILGAPLPIWPSPSLEKFSTDLASPTSLKPLLGPPPPPKFRMPKAPSISGKRPREWSPGILKRIQHYPTLEEEPEYMAPSPQPSSILVRSIPTVKFAKEPLARPAQVLQTSQVLDTSQVSQKVHFPPIDSSLQMPSLAVTETSKMTVPPSSPGEFFVSAPALETKRFFIDVESQRKNLAILSRATERYRLPLMLHHTAKELIIETHYTNQIRLGYLFRKYIAYRLIQSARQNIVNRLKAIRNSGKGNEAQILYVFLSRLDTYQKRVMEAWTRKQRILEYKRNVCMSRMMYLYGQIQKKIDLNLNFPILLVTHKEEQEHPLKAVCFKHVVRRAMPEKLEKEQKSEALKKLEKEKDKVEAIWRADLSTSSFPIDTKTPVKLLWDQIGGYPDIPRLLELDVRSTFTKSLATIQSRFRKIPK